MHSKFHISNTFDFSEEVKMNLYMLFSLYANFLLYHIGKYIQDQYTGMGSKHTTLLSACNHAKFQYFLDFQCH